MRKIIVLLVFFAFVVGLVLVPYNMVFSWWGRDKGEVAEAEETEQPKLIYKFKNAEEMTEFEQFYISKQATFGRMGVLQAYFAMEQSNLTEIDRQMEEKFGFKMDLNTMYNLDRDAMEIREAGPLAPTQAPAATATE